MCDTRAAGQVEHPHLRTVLGQGNQCRVVDERVGDIESCQLRASFEDGIKGGRGHTFGVSQFEHFKLWTVLGNDLHGGALVGVLKQHERDQVRAFGQQGLEGGLGDEGGDQLEVLEQQGLLPALDVQ